MKSINIFYKTSAMCAHIPIFSNDILNDYNHNSMVSIIIEIINNIESSDTWSIFIDFDTNNELISIKINKIWHPYAHKTYQFNFSFHDNLINIHMSSAYSDTRKVNLEYYDPCFLDKLRQILSMPETRNQNL